MATLRVNRSRADPQNFNLGFLVQTLLPRPAVVHKQPYGSDRGQREHARPAVFLDRDGVIIQNRDDYVKTWDEVQVFPGVLGQLQRVAASTDLLVVMVSNQAAVAHGKTSLEMVQYINRRLINLTMAAGGRVDGVYICPHGPADGCQCRKPAPGMLLEAAHDLGIDLSRSWMVGDAVTDVRAGVAVGARPLLVLTGRGREQRENLPNDLVKQTVIVPDLRGAVDYIMEHNVGDVSKGHPGQVVKREEQPQ